MTLSSPGCLKDISNNIHSKKLSIMKNIKFIVILLAVPFTACDSDMINRLDDMAGTWQCGWCTLW